MLTLGCGLPPPIKISGYASDRRAAFFIPEVNTGGSCERYEVWM